MAYINTSHFNEGATETSNYSELTPGDEGDVSYSTIQYDRRTETVGLSAVNLEPSNTVQRPNIHTRVIEHDGIEKSTDPLSLKCTCQKFNLKLILVIIGMIVIAAASSTITALLLKQNFDDLLTDIRDEMNLKKQDISQESDWSEWSPWGECSASCNGGIQSRVRTCDESDKGPHACVGNTIEILACNNNTCDSKCNNNTCEENTWSEWSQWSPWGECSAPCNGGIQSRLRTCDESDKGQHACIGNTIEMSACNNNTCVVPMVYFALRLPKAQLVSGKVTFILVLRHVGGGYNTTTGIFTCPVAGLYHFYFSFMQESTTAVWCYLMHNNSLLGQAETFSDGTGDAASTASYVHLDVGDIISVGNCVGWEHVNHLGNEGVFTGALIHV